MFRRRRGALSWAGAGRPARDRCRPAMARVKASRPRARGAAKRTRLPRPLFKSHPWHGVPIGADAPDVVTVYIEIVPSDTVKYELDKDTGLLKIDRPQRFSNVCPTLYGFIPQTHCGERNAEMTARRRSEERRVGKECRAR